MKPTAAGLMRAAGVAAIIAGSLFIIIQAIHPADVLSSVGTGRWVLVHVLGVAMGMFALFGVSGIHARQVEKAGWLGLAGYALFALFWAITMAFQFVEAFVTPALTGEAPRFVEGVLGIASNTKSDVDLGALPAINAVTGFAGYVLGGLLFGIATFRAGVLPRRAGALLAMAALSVLAAPVIGHPFDRLLAIPMGAALMWLGSALASNSRPG
jgi:hypothetical protein